MTVVVVAVASMEGQIVAAVVVDDVAAFGQVVEVEYTMEIMTAELVVWVHHIEVVHVVLSEEEQLDVGVRMFAGLVFERMLEFAVHIGLLMVPLIPLRMGDRCLYYQILMISMRPPSYL